jgi:hypothetical protein
LALSLADNFWPKKNTPEPFQRTQFKENRVLTFQRLQTFLSYFSYSLQVFTVQLCVFSFFFSFHNLFTYFLVFYFCPSFHTLNSVFTPSFNLQIFIFFLI